MKKLGVVLLFLIAITACGKHDNVSSPAAEAPMPVNMVAPKMATREIAQADTSEVQDSLTEASEPLANNSPVKKYIALRHSLTVETKAEAMQATFDATLKQCEALNCQVLNASFNRETHYQFGQEIQYTPPNASISLRIPPRSIAIFLTDLAKSSEILQHGQNVEDKTNQVIDAEARIKNLTEFRNNLRTMLSDKSAKFKDLIEVQRELVNTQSELDSIQGVRKVLALETEMVVVDINFTAAQGITETGFFAPVAQAIKNAGHVLMESIAHVITFIMAMLPWMLLAIPALVLARKLWMKIKGKY